LGSTLYCNGVVNLSPNISMNKNGCEVPIIFYRNKRSGKVESVFVLFILMTAILTYAGKT
jgi:hypothetical protein